MTIEDLKIEETITEGNIRCHEIAWFPTRITPPLATIIGRLPEALQKPCPGEGAFSLLFQLPDNDIRPDPSEQRIQKKIRLWDLHNPELCRRLSDVWDRTNGNDTFIIFRSCEQGADEKSIAESIVTSWKRKWFDFLPLSQKDLVSIYIKTVADLGDKFFLIEKMWDGGVLFATFGPGCREAEKAFFSLLELTPDS